MPNQWIILKIGGSLLSPKQAKPDQLFNFSYAQALLSLLKNDFRQFSFALIVGGGRVNQLLLDQANAFVAKQGREVQDYYQNHVGIAAINLNAHLLLTIASTVYAEEEFYPEVLKYGDFDHLPTRKQLNQQRILITAADKPGHTSDYNAYQLAKQWGSKFIISLKDIDGVYTADPRKNPQAKKISAMSWQQYQEQLGDVAMKPRSHFPVDVVTGPLAAKAGISYIIMDGRNLDDVSGVLRGEKMPGTLLYP